MRGIDSGCLTNKPLVDYRAESSSKAVLKRNWRVLIVLEGRESRSHDYTYMAEERWTVFNNATDIGSASP